MGWHGIGGPTDLCSNVGNLLNRTSLTSPSVLCSDDEAIGPLAKFLVERVILIDDKGLLKGFESVPLGVECMHIRHG